MAKDKNYRFKEDDGRHTILLIGVLLVLIVIVGGGLLMLLTHKGSGTQPAGNASNITPPAGNQTLPPEQNITANETACDDSCMLAKAVDSANYSACYGLPSDQLIQSCLAQLSPASLDACRALQESAAKTSCISSFASSSGNLSLCDLIIEGRDGCRKAVDACIDSDDQALCRALEAKDPKLCAGSQECIFDYAMEAKSDAACALIQNKPVSAACGSAALGSDKCSALGLLPEKDYCYQLYAVQTYDLYLCDRINRNTVYDLECLSYFAGNENDLRICDRDSLSLDSKWACYTNFSLISGNFSGCEGIHKLATTNRFRCAFEYGKKYGNPAACQLIEELPTRSTCYEGVIIYSNENLNWTYCGDVTNFNWRNKCFSESAMLYDDVTICDYLPDSYARESCIDAYIGEEG